MSERTDRDFLEDILQAMHRISTYIADASYEIFLKDTKTQDAVIRNLQVIGEATKNLSPEMRSKYVHVPWKDMAAVRDRVIHRYFGVNLDIVWQIAADELPKVAEQIKQILPK
ncbi:MAG TPA: DUF86 domain-containing protein [bacterium]|nr:DUF86 domain-containing protein [bacterium]HPO09228.1 DUF86 domain-containing protein [bacterium]HQO35612.1 DUF86 domain-containing protein [bacterium]HQP97605.1 DUF86 domain-containing protein [bacterium]